MKLLLQLGMHPYWYQYLVPVPIPRLSTEIIKYVSRPRHQYQSYRKTNLPSLALHAANLMLRGSLPGQGYHPQFPQAGFSEENASFQVKTWPVRVCCPRHKGIHSKSWQLVRFHHWHPARCRPEPRSPWVMVIGPGNGYDGCFTAGFTGRAQTG